ncbi:MAG: Tfp pilus assembly protein FimT/FimU [Smithella sp.]
MRIKESKGFSLVEIMMVLVLIGFMATLSFYSYVRYVDNANLRAVARQLAADMNVMKARAVSEIDTVATITFYTATNSYILSGSATRAAQTVSFPSLPFGLGQDVTIKSLPGGGTNYTLTFLTRGLLSPSPTAITNCSVTAGSCWIVLQNSRGSQATITFVTTGKTYVTFAMQ